VEYATRLSHPPPLVLVLARHDVRGDALKMYHTNKCFMEILRQSDDTTIPELFGRRASRMLGVGRSLVAGACFLYLNVDKSWYRFFIDCRILFWVTSAPDREDDLADDEEYVDVFDELGVAPQQVIRSIEMKNGILEFQFDNCSKIVIFKDEDAGVMRVKCT
jgi:hypothetical protein